MTTIATICARGGSQGVPKKNIRPLLGKPLIVYSIEQALNCPEIDAVYVSTDDEEIAKIAEKAGAIIPFIRPKELATNSAPKLPVIIHLVDFLENNKGVSIKRIVDLDPTSPLRELEDIQACLSLLDDQTNLVITGYPSEKNPYFNMVEEGPQGRYQLVKKVENDFFSRQESPKVYSMNGSVYVWHRYTLSTSLWNGFVKLHIMPRERSIDIDHPIDFTLVELLMKEKMNQKLARVGG